MYWFLFQLWSCDQESEVMTGVPQEPLLAEKRSAEEIRDDNSQGEQQTAIYSKPEGVDVDVFQLTGKMFQEVQGDLADQMGDFISRHQIQQKNGERRIYQRGEIKMENGQIYMMKFKLQNPMRRAEALKAAGFPKFVDKYINLRHSYRVDNEWDFKIIRMKKESPDSEMVTHFEASKPEPKERVRR